MSERLGDRQRPTIEDVARIAGVSRQTVSRAINAKSEIREETRERVLAAVEELGYRPNRLAQGMVTRRTRTVALLAGDIRNPFFGEVAHGASHYLRQHEHSLLVVDTDEDAEREIDALQELAHDVDGIIAFLYHSDAATVRALSLKVPALVVVNRDVTLAHGRVLGIDIPRGARLAAAHLLDRGHRRIAVIENATQRPGEGRRVVAFADAIRDRGLDLVTLPADPTIAGGRIVGARLVAEHPEVTAVFGYNDLVAAGIIAAARAVGRRVPEDLAVVGCDDTAMAAVWDPPLTTIRIDAQRVGAVAAAHALDLLGVGGAAPGETLLDVELIVRGSA